MWVSLGQEGRAVDLAWGVVCKNGFEVTKASQFKYCMAGMSLRSWQGHKGDVE